MAHPKNPNASHADREVGRRSVFLIGFMGAGKTTVGRELARKLDCKFIDLDDRIEAAEGQSIAEIFSRSGEEAFRRAESLALTGVLAELHQGPGAVVALGGGAFVQPNNAAAIRATESTVVFLDAPAEELRRRCLPRGAARPLFQDSREFERLYESRKSSYVQADLCVDTAGKTALLVVDEVLIKLGVRNS